MSTDIGVKQGALIEGLAWQIFVAIGYCWGVFKEVGVQLVITSGTDSVHSPRSLHYSARAIDIRIRDFPGTLLSQIFKKIHDDLDTLGFDIVLEGNHIHLEWDPHPGDTPLTMTVQ